MQKYRLLPKKEESLNWNCTQNLYIEGDNIEVLQLLQKDYRRNIKMIYIDPPYNTGHSFVYKDNWHTHWLDMMQPRLVLAESLLSDDGVIFISIDDNEVHNLRNICDGIFGEEHFVGQVVWLKKNAQNDAKNMQKNHEYILCYKKEKTVLTDVKEQKKEVFNDGIRWYYIGAPLTTGGVGSTLNSRPNLGYSVYYNGETGDFLALADYDVNLAKTSNAPHEVYKDNNALLNEGYHIIRPPKRGARLGCWTWSLDKFNSEKDRVIIHKNTVAKKEFVEPDSIYEENGRYYSTIQKCVPFKSFIDDVPSSEGTKELNALFGEKVFDNPKPTRLIRRYMKHLQPGDIVLDFFSGSATTAHAAMEEGLRFIMVQIPEKNICEIGKERIRLAGAKITAQRQPGQTSPDVGFRVYKLD